MSDCLLKTAMNDETNLLLEPIGQPLFDAV